MSSRVEALCYEYFNKCLVYHYWRYHHAILVRVLTEPQFLVSLMPYIALPLSGFTLELTSGYSSAMWDGEIDVYGQTKATFLDQNLDEVFTRSFGRWSSAGPSTLSGRSAYYMPANDTIPLGRSWLNIYPNDWPDYVQMTVFIAPQSPGILRGKGWGLESNLSCSTIDSIDQFELLSQRNADKTAPRCPPINFNSSGESPEYIGLPDLCDYDVYTLHQPSNETLLPLYMTTNSYFPVGEMEIAVKYDKAGYDDSDLFSDPEPVVMEVALWQNPIELVGRQCPRLSEQLSNELGVVVKGMEKDFRLSDVSAILTGQTDQSSKRLSAIGVQCKSTFRTGTATINGLSGTYASFTHEPADSLVSATPVPAPIAVPRIFRSEISGAINLLDMYKTQALQSVIGALTVDWTSGSNMDLNPVAYIASNVSWLTNVYKSVAAYSRTAMYCDGDDPTTTSSWQQLQLIDSRQLQQSLTGAYKAYALEMTKPSTITFSSSTLHPVRPTSIISPGKIPPVAVLVLLAVWALGSCTLGLMFGLRPRWSETLDGFSMFRFGSDQPGFSINEAAYVQHYSDCQGLRRLPGMVEASKDTEHVTLVRRHRLY